MIYHDVSLVGSMAWWYVGKEDNPNDIDMIVEPGRLPEVNLHFKEYGAEISINNMGGIKATINENLEVDYWEDTIRNYCRKVRSMNFGKIAIVSLNPKFILTEDNS